jgi:hypothetical protein
MHVAAATPIVAMGNVCIATPEMSRRDKDPRANEEQRAQSAGIRFALNTATEHWIGETGATQ